MAREIKIQEYFCPTCNKKTTIHLVDMTTKKAYCKVCNSVANKV